MMAGAYILSAPTCLVGIGSLEEATRDIETGEHAIG